MFKNEVFSLDRSKASFEISCESAAYLFKQHK